MAPMYSSSPLEKMHKDLLSDLAWAWPVPIPKELLHIAARAGAFSSSMSTVTVMHEEDGADRPNQL